MDALKESLLQMKMTNIQTNSTECSENGKDTCPICKDTGIEIIKVDGHAYARDCKCGLIQATIERNKGNFADIPLSFKDVKIENFDPGIYKNTDSRNKAVILTKCIRYWVDNFEEMKNGGMGLYMFSDAKGSGKTMMAVGIANKIMKSNKCSVKFCTSLKILSEIRASWDKSNGSSESKLLEMLTAADVLVIDDFGTEQSDKPWINERFYQIINDRYVGRKITIFTSNEKLDLLKYDDRIKNRIKERTYQLPFPEESVRDIIAKDNMRNFIEKAKMH